MSYAWKRNTADTWKNNFEGGQALLWDGSGNCDYMVLNQSVVVYGFSASITWPPSISTSSNSSYWQSQPIYENVAGASFSGMKINGTAFSCEFTENGDVYKAGRIYRPMTYIRFDYSS